MLGKYSVEVKLFMPYIASVWHQRDIPEPRPSPRYGQSQLFLDDHHVLVMGGLGGPNNVFNDVWLLDMEPGKELENSTGIGKSTNPGSEKMR